MNKANNSNRIIALIAVFAIVVLMHFSDLYISEHLNHHCTEPDSCPVCSMLESCASNLKTISSGLSMAVTATLAVVVLYVVAINYNYESVQTTLISQKVRLDS